MAWYPLEDRVLAIKKILDLPESVIPLSILPIGYPDEFKDKNDKYNELRIHSNKW